MDLGGGLKSGHLLTVEWDLLKELDINGCVVLSRLRQRLLELLSLDEPDRRFLGTVVAFSVLLIEDHALFAEGGTALEYADGLLASSLLNLPALYKLN